MSSDLLRHAFWGGILFWIAILGPIILLGLVL